MSFTYNKLRDNDGTLLKVTAHTPGGTLVAEATWGDAGIKYQLVQGDICRPGDAGVMHDNMVQIFRDDQQRVANELGRMEE